jgi:hypothetical protein
LILSNLTLSTLFLAIALICPASSFSQDQLAFPSAEGCGLGSDAPGLSSIGHWFCHTIIDRFNTYRKSDEDEPFLLEQVGGSPAGIFFKGNSKCTYEEVLYGQH